MTEILTFRNGETLRVGGLVIRHLGHRQGKTRLEISGPGSFEIKRGRVLPALPDPVATRAERAAICLGTFSD